MPPGNINVTDSQGQQNLMAKGQVASTFSDYSGNVGTLYNVKASSSVVGKVKYLKTPGASGPPANLSNPDGIGIPKQAKYPDAAAKFIEWFTATEQQADFAGVNGPEKTFATYPIPSHLSAVKKMTAKGSLVGGDGPRADAARAPSRSSRVARRRGTRSSPTPSTPTCTPPRPAR